MGRLGGWTKLQLSFQTGAQISLRIQQTSGTVARFTRVRLSVVGKTLNVTMLASKDFELNRVFFSCNRKLCWKLGKYQLL